jgi:adenosylcobinamide-phosphate synthase
MLTGLSVPHVALMVLAGVILDLLLGELPRWHPLAGFGRWADVVERCLNRGQHRFGRGLLACGTRRTTLFLYRIAQPA